STEAPSRIGTLPDPPLVSPAGLHATVLPLGEAGNGHGGTPMSGAAAGDEAHVRFEDVHMAFEERAVLRGLTCGFPHGKISVILGGSGSGKTTILRLIGGLVHPRRGRIIVAGEDVSRLSETELYHVRAKLGMMFQGGALLDSLTIFDNVAFPLREHTE